jgi:hypothetical protein
MKKKMNTIVELGLFLPEGWPYDARTTVKRIVFDPPINSSSDEIYRHVRDGTNARDYTTARFVTDDEEKASE